MRKYVYILHLRKSATVEIVVSVIFQCELVF